MIRSVMFYLNQNKPSVCEAVQTGVKLCRQKGIEPVFLKATVGFFRKNWERNLNRQHTCLGRISLNLI